VFWVPLAIGVGVALALVVPWPWALGGGAILFLLLFLFSVWYPSLAFDAWGYQLRPDDLLIAHGVIVRQVAAIPTNRIQHVDTKQGPLEQWLGLARVLVYTASGMGADGVIPGLDLDDAEDLRDRLVALGGDDGV